ncbi:MAG: M42 family metallopeptidase [Defluviitaleaceae bacterium]|nr:M42 family metallopeptidase [Defluviitaleaceae bacterium]
MSLNLPKDYFTQTLAEILSIDSPTGFTRNVISKIRDCVHQLGYDSYLTNKGNLVVNMPGTGSKTVGISTHVDTLGLMVRGVNGDGTLTFTTVGGPILPTLDGEYCSIYTRCGRVYTGTILSNSPASHVYNDASGLERNNQNMHVRLDEPVNSAEDTKALGILPGDFICYDPKTIIMENGFIKSRFLDDKLSAAIVLATLKHFKDNNITPIVNAKIIFSTYEEVGHGLSHLPEGITELLAIDMGCIGKDLSCTEYDVSICAKDSSGPYDYEFTTRLINLAKEAELGYAVDIYPFYGSDASAAVRAGHDVVIGLIGPGVTASHGMERSHMSACENTFKLLCLYLRGSHNA